MSGRECPHRGWRPETCPPGCKTLESEGVPECGLVSLETETEEESRLVLVRYSIVKESTNIDRRFNTITGNGRLDYRRMSV